jgi:hypothetical protein
VRLPHENVRAWLETWRTPEEKAAREKLDALEERLRIEARRSAHL